MQYALLHSAPSGCLIPLHSSQQVSSQLALLTQAAPSNVAWVICIWVTAESIPLQTWMAGVLHLRGRQVRTMVNRVDLPQVLTWQQYSQ